MKKAVSRVYLALIYLFLYAPILLLVVFSFNDTDTKSRTVWSGFSLRWYEMLFEDRMLLQALTNTLIIAVSAAIGATLLGTLAAIGISSMKSWRKKVVMNITNLPMLNPEIVKRSGSYSTEEGCLSLTGTRPVKRWKSIKVRWQNEKFQERLKTFTGWTAQIIQHEIDHCEGILI